MSKENLEKSELDNTEEPGFEVDELELGEVNHSEMENKIYEITLQIQEIESQMEMCEMEFLKPEVEMDEEKQEELYQTLGELQIRYKELRIQLKTINKAKRQENKTIWDRLPVWMLIYGMIQIIFSSSLLMPTVTGIALDVVEKILGTLFRTKFGAFVVVFGVTVVNLSISGILFAVVYKNKFKRKIFAIIFALHGLAAMTAVISLWPIFIALLKQV